MGAGHQKDQPLISSLGFSTPPRIVLRGENSWNAVNDPSLLRDEASLKIPKVWGSETFWVDAHVEVWGEGYVQSACGSSVPLPTYLALHSSSTWMLICILSHILLEQPGEQ